MAKRRTRPDYSNAAQGRPDYDSEAYPGEDQRSIDARTRAYDGLNWAIRKAQVPAPRRRAKDKRSAIKQVATAQFVELRRTMTDKEAVKRVNKELKT